MEKFEKQITLPHEPIRGILEFGSFHPVNRSQVNSFSIRDQNSWKWRSIGQVEGSESCARF